MFDTRCITNSQSLNILLASESHTFNTRLSSTPNRYSGHFQNPIIIMQQEGYGKTILTHVLAGSSFGVLSAAFTRFLQPNSEKRLPKDQIIVPLLERNESGRVGKIEKFSYYVARQIGFEDPSECPQLCKLAYEYLMKSKDCESIIYEYLANEPNGEELYMKLVEEFDRCILSYFAFHWSQASHIISQVLTIDSEQKMLKELVMAATRKQRFEKVAKDLKVKRLFFTLVEEMKAIGGISSNGQNRAKCTEVMVPVAHSKRSPVLLLMGGGMGAGKSTVLKDILKEPFWEGAEGKAVVVEADAFKETDVIYRALSSSGHHGDMLPTAELVHQSSTDAASSLLVTALNEGRDVIMDGTLSWEPFVEQTIAMARNVHSHRYRMGVGYKVNEDGTVTENYWEKAAEEEEEEEPKRKPYRIELVGVVCDAYLAVARGMRRAIQTGRAVRVNSQLKSHKRFASGFQRYCQLVDSARLYCTNTLAGPPRFIARKDGESKLLVDPDEFKCLTAAINLNDKADSIYELYEEGEMAFKPGSIWNDTVLLPSRASLQLELKTAIQKIERDK
ncbi:hypothetical protein NMG60_11025469 [Bertholletia excelsa]